MNYDFVLMNKDYANEIAYEWKYEGIYSFYDIEKDKEDLEEFINEDNWGDTYFAVLNKKELIGLFSYRFIDDIMYIGLGLKPNLVGQKLGQGFVSEGIEFALNKFDYSNEYIMLEVALFNKRAIRLYENLGFEFVEKYMQVTNDSEYEFIKMKKYINK